MPRRFGGDGSLWFSLCAAERCVIASAHGAADADAIAQARHSSDREGAQSTCACSLPSLAAEHLTLSKPSCAIVHGPSRSRPVYRYCSCSMLAALPATSTSPCVRACVRVCVHVRVCLRRLACVRACVRAWPHAFIFTHRHARTVSLARSRAQRLRARTFHRSRSIPTITRARHLLPLPLH